MLMLLGRLIADDYRACSRENTQHQSAPNIYQKTLIRARVSLHRAKPGGGKHTHESSALERSAGEDPTFIWLSASEAFPRATSGRSIPPHFPRMGSVTLWRRNLALLGGACCLQYGAWPTSVKRGHLETFNPSKSSIASFYAFRSYSFCRDKRE